MNPIIRLNNQNLPTKSRKGFTLIELMVVISIISFLSSIILTFVNSARDKAKDAVIRSQLASMRSAAEVYYNGNGLSYGATSANCDFGMFTDAGMQLIKNKVEIDNGTGAVGCNSISTAWAVKTPLVSSTKYFCVDSKGTAKVTNSDPNIVDQTCTNDL